MSSFVVVVQIHSDEPCGIQHCNLIAYLHAPKHETCRYNCRLGLICSNTRCSIVATEYTFSVSPLEVRASRTSRVGQGTRTYSCVHTHSHTHRRQRWPPTYVCTRVLVFVCTSARTRTCLRYCVCSGVYVPALMCRQIGTSRVL